MIETNRRSLITGLISLIAAPAIIRAGSLMPIKTMPLESIVAFAALEETHVDIGELRYDNVHIWIYDGFNWIKISDC